MQPVPEDASPEKRVPTMTQIDHKFLASFSVRVGTKRHRIELAPHDDCKYRVRIDRRYHDEELDAHQVANLVVDLALGEQVQNPQPDDCRKYTRCSVWIDEGKYMGWNQCTVLSEPVKFYDGEWYVFVSCLAGRVHAKCSDIKIKVK